MKLGKAAMYTKFGLRCAGHGLTTGAHAALGAATTVLLAPLFTVHAIASERTQAFLAREAHRAGSPLSNVVAES